MKESSNLINLHDLQLVILPGRVRQPNARDYYQATYRTWQTVWTETLKEVDGLQKLHSDHFTRQDFIIALFHGPLCVALCCFRRAELWFNGDLADSWFQPWPENLLVEIKENYEKGIVVSWVTIHPDYRRTLGVDHLNAVNASARLCEATNLFLLNLELDVVFGITRNERSVNKMALYTGFEVLQSGAVHHDEPANLIIATHETLGVARDKFPAKAFSIWENKLVIPDEPLNFPFRKFSKLRLVG